MDLRIQVKQDVEELEGVFTGMGGSTGSGRRGLSPNDYEYIDYEFYDEEIGEEAEDWESYYAPPPKPTLLDFAAPVIAKMESRDVIHKQVLDYIEKSENLIKDCKNIPRFGEYVEKLEKKANDLSVEHKKVIKSEFSDSRQVGNLKAHSEKFYRFVHSVLQELKGFKWQVKRIESAFADMDKEILYKFLNLYKILNDISSQAKAKAGSTKTTSGYTAVFMKAGGIDRYEELKKARDQIYNDYKEILETRKNLRDELERLKQNPHSVRSDFTSYVEKPKRLKTKIELINKRIVEVKAEFLKFIPPTEKKTFSGKRPVRVDIIPQPSPLTVANLFPQTFANENSVASDIINSPTGGWTRFKYKGDTVYHSSSGSSVSNNCGTAFWTMATGNSAVWIIAIGKHTGNSSDEYKITWKADPVKLPGGKTVKLKAENEVDKKKIISS